MQFKIEYDVKLNDDGRPYIVLNSDFNNVPEHRFFAFEITRHILFDLVEKNRIRDKSNRISEANVTAIENTATSLTVIADEMAKIIRGNMEHSDGLRDLINDYSYDISVDYVTDLDIIKDSGFVFNDKIYIKKHNLKVMVVENMCIYQLQGSIGNEKWVNLTPNKKPDESSENETQI